jgi:hypothetical protein
MLQLFEFELNKYPLNAPSESRYRGGMENTKPGTGTDYPRTFEEMDEWFRTEAGCRAYIRRLRWPGGFVCGCCGVTGEPWVMARGIFRCKACHGNTPLTAGTAMRATRGGRQIGSTRRPNRGNLRVLPAPSRTSLARRQCVSLSPAPPHGVVGVPKKNQISCRQVDSETRDPCCDCRRCQAFPMSSSLVPYRGKSRLQHSYITVKAAVEIMGKKPHAPHLRHQFGARSPLPYSHFSASQIAFNMLSNARFAAVTQSLYSLAL